MPTSQNPNSRQLTNIILRTDLDVGQQGLATETFEHHLTEEATSERQPELHVEYKGLLAALRSLQRTSKLSQTAHAAIAQGPKLVERMAADSDKMAAEAGQRNKEDKDYHEHVAATLRQRVIPTLGALSAKLETFQTRGRC